MDLISAFKSELFRPLATVITPGTIAIAPWIFIFMTQNSFVMPYISEYSIASGFFIIILITAAGFILENIGARIEATWDKLLSTSENNNTETWKSYLKLKIKDEIVGQRYLRTIVIRMKFELAIAPALISCLIGIVVLNGYQRYWSCETIILTAALLMLVAIYLLYESYMSAKICASTRNLILESAENISIS